MGYFTVQTRPTIPASKQHAGNISDTHVLFDWTEFEIPNGTSTLFQMSAIIDGKNGADYAAALDFELIFAKSHNHVAPTTLGEVGAAVDTPGWKHNVIARHLMDASAYSNDGDLIFMNVQTGMLDRNRICLSPEMTTGAYNKLYVAGISKGNSFNWQSSMTVDGTPATTQKNLDVASVSALLGVAPGDVLHDEDDRLMGTVSSVTDATNILMVDNLANAGVNAKKLYNVHPIKLILGFEN